MYLTGKNTESLEVYNNSGGLFHCELLSDRSPNKFLFSRLKCYKHMNAIKPEPNKPRRLQPVENRSLPVQGLSGSNARRSSGVTAEITAKLIVNVVLSTAAIATLMQLAPYAVSQQAKLQEVKAEVQRTENRLKRLNDKLGRSFDPQQSRSVMQEQTDRVEPNKKNIFYLEKSREEPPSE
jgi:cell division protein FtsB